MGGLSPDDEEFLAQILGEPDPPATSQSPNPTKCVHVFVGGTDLRDGATSDASDPRFCSELFCISCDHKVIRFKDRKWKEGTDYLFLRNNYPDKVSQNLVLAPKSCAFCCQCTFSSEQTTRKLPAFSSTWVCRGHN
jgi:hypothetical protein